MHQKLVLLAAILLTHLFSLSALAQEDRLQGRWEGTTKSIQGERPTTVIFKKEADGYSGTITGAQGTTPFKELKVNGDQVTAQADVDSPQAGRLSLNYKFVVQGEALKGEGSVEIGGQTYNFTVDLKRTTTSTAPPQRGRLSGPTVPQPTQKQSLEYFVGQWKFKWLGRESALGPGGPREGVTTFKLKPGTQTLESQTEGKTEAGAFMESAVISFDEATKLLSFSEQRRDVRISSKGDWTSPLAIRFSIEPIKLNQRTLHLRRAIAIVSAHSFTLTEELSEDGGPFVRLGQAVFSKVPNQ